jgi:hypothetical protein
MTQNATSTSTEKPNLSSQGDYEKNSGDRNRLAIALTLIVGLIIILIIPVVQGQFTQAEQLAAIFSGWITTIVAFYFYGQSNAAAQTQINNTAASAAKSEQEANQANKKLAQIKGMTKGYTVRAFAATDRAPEAKGSDEIVKKIGEVLDQD